MARLCRAFFRESGCFLLGAVENGDKIGSIKEPPAIVALKEQQTQG